MDKLTREYRITSKLMGEKPGYIGYLVHNDKITWKTARCLINRKNEVPPEYKGIINDLYEKAEYSRLNAVCEEVIF